MRCLQDIRQYSQSEHRLYFWRVPFLRRKQDHSQNSCLQFYGHSGTSLQAFTIFPQVRICYDQIVATKRNGQLPYDPLFAFFWWRCRMPKWLTFRILPPRQGLLVCMSTYHTLSARCCRTRILQGFSYGILPVDQFVEDDLLRAVTDAVHGSDLCHQVSCLGYCWVLRCYL